MGPVVSFADFDRSVEEYEIPVEQVPEAFAHWLGEQTGEPIRLEKVEPGHEQILPDHAQRELDSLPSALDRQDAD